MARYELGDYDGVLAFGEVIRQLYLRQGWTQQAWTWHEAADTRLFHPHPQVCAVDDLVWIGNWGDGERSDELHEFLLEPARELGLSGVVHGVRYPDQAREALLASGLRYGGWVANFQVPAVFASTGSRCMCLAVPTCKCCRASRPFARSRRWPAGFRW